MGAASHIGRRRLDRHVRNRRIVDVDEEIERPHFAGCRVGDFDAAHEVPVDVAGDVAEQQLIGAENRRKGLGID